MKKAGFLSRGIVAIALLGCVGSLAYGQSTSSSSAESAAPKGVFVPHYYHLVFVVKELEGGKVINSREYVTSIATTEHQSNNMSTRSIRNGTKFPVESEQNKLVYIDVGVNIDCKDVVDLGDRLGMGVSAEISSVQNASVDDHSRPETAMQHAAPMIQQNKWNSDVVVVLGKPTVLFSSDGATSKRTLQLELTATPMK